MKKYIINKFINEFHDDIKILQVYNVPGTPHVTTHTVKE